jgi:hypothetical protein
MAMHVVDVNTATVIRRPKGQQVTVVNNTAQVVYVDTNVNRLNSWPLVAGVLTPNGGTPIPAVAALVPGVLQIDNFPGELWARATAQTIIEVLP